MQNEAWLQFFMHALQDAGLTLSDKHSGLFLRYMHELLDWNRTTNITRIVDPQAIAIKHFIDSLMLTNYIDIRGKSLADVGSGGGFPGIPLAIIDPGCSVVLMEPARKKTAFLKHAVRTLRLDNVRIYSGKAQSYPAPATFDLAVSRAFASIADFTLAARHLIVPNGTIVCMKGQLPEDEIEELRQRSDTPYRVTHHSYCLPVQPAARSVVVVREQ